MHPRKKCTFAFDPESRRKCKETIGLTNLLREVKQHGIAVVGFPLSVRDISFLRRFATQKNHSPLRKHGTGWKFAHYLDKVSFISGLDNGTLLIASRRSTLWASAACSTPRALRLIRARFLPIRQIERGSENRWIVALRPDCTGAGTRIRSTSVTLTWF
jgi:hypothetical protein